MLWMIWVVFGVMPEGSVIRVRTPEIGPVEYGLLLGLSLQPMGYPLSKRFDPIKYVLFGLRVGTGIFEPIFAGAVHAKIQFIAKSGELLSPCREP